MQKKYLHANYVYILAYNVNKAYNVNLSSLQATFLEYVDILVQMIYR